MFKKLIVFSAFFFTLAVFADDPNQQVSTEELVAAIFQFAGGLKGISALGIVAGVTQLFMKFFNTSLASFAGRWKMLIVLILSLVGTVFSQMIEGLSLPNALISGATLAGLQVLLHETWSQLAPKKS